MLIQRHVPCYITHCSVLRHTPLMLPFLFIYFRQPVNGLLQASATRCRLYQEWSGGWVGGGGREGGSAAVETEEQVRPGPPSPPPLQSPSSRLGSSLQKPTVEEMSVLESAIGTLHAQTRSFLSWHSSSWGLCKDFPAFHSLPVYVSLSHSFGWLPFSKLPQSSGLFFFPRVCALEVWKSVWGLVGMHFPII